MPPTVQMEKLVELIKKIFFFFSLKQENSEKIQNSNVDI